MVNLMHNEESEDPRLWSSLLYHVTGCDIVVANSANQAYAIPKLIVLYDLSIPQYIYWSYVDFDSIFAFSRAPKIWFASPEHNRQFLIKERRQSLISLQSEHLSRALLFRKWIWAKPFTSESSNINNIQCHIYFHTSAFIEAVVASSMQPINE